jgi:FtsP/CotA-like multicopper oxidase with cupredoxin domain
MTIPTRGRSRNDRRWLPTATAGPAEAVTPETVELADGDLFVLHIALVAKRLGDATVRMLAYNGSIPGTTLTVPQGAEIVVNVINDGEMATTGAQARAAAGEPVRRHPPDSGARTGRWSVHLPGPESRPRRLLVPTRHVREDYGQEMGMYGSILVVPADPGYWPPVHREVLLTLDDVLMEDGKIAPFRRTETTYAAMGRYGDLLLTAGDTALFLDAQRGEVVRLHLTNTANTRGSTWPCPAHE